MMQEKKHRRSVEQLKHYRPYKKQREFHFQGLGNRERLFMAGNQLGKTVAGAAELAMHLSGLYPDWWEGHRFSNAISAIAGSESAELTRDGVQRLLVGPPNQETEWGTGFIPQRTIINRTRRMGVANALDSVTVQHISGRVSTLLFKSYDQGRSKWQANSVDYVWFDEEPPEDVYFEGLTRTNARSGLVCVTFTPLKGVSSVVARYTMEKSIDRCVTTMTIDDAEHYCAQQRQKIIESYPAHEREARIKGIPSLGSGRVFPVMEETIIVTPFDVPTYFSQIVGIDYGWDHPFAAARLAWDRDNDIIYVTACYRARQETPIIHAASLRPWGDWLPIAWPHDGLQHDKGSGIQLAEQYRTQGLNLLAERATFLDGSNGVEAGVMEILQRMQTGRWKVFSNCLDWLEEFRIYHRKDGKLVKEREDVLSASRYAMMMMRFATTPPTKMKAQWKPISIL